MHVSRALPFAVSVAAACGCSSGGANPPGTIGSVGGMPLAYTQQVAYVDDDSAREGGAPVFSDTVIVLSNRADTCAASQAGEAIANMDHFKIVIQSPGLASTPPGAYAVDGAAISAAHLVYDAHCGYAVADTATQGKVTLTEIDSRNVAGSFDVTLRSGSRLTGTFAAPTCDVAPDAGLLIKACVP